MGVYSWFDRDKPIIKDGVYFHGTSKWHADLILKVGLDPKKMEACWRKEEWRHAKERGEKFKLKDQPYWSYLSVSRDWAASWAERFNKDTTVLQIEPPKDLITQFVTNLGEFIRVPVLIPPEFIKVADMMQPSTRKLTADEKAVEIAEFERLRAKYPELCLRAVSSAGKVEYVVPHFLTYVEELEED